MELRRIGIVRLSAIGDVIHAMPLAMGLRRAYPSARITWIVQPGAAPLLDGHPAIDDVLLFPRRGSLRERARFLQRLRDLRLDATVDPQGNAKSGAIALLSGAPVRAGLHPGDCKEPVNVFATNRRGQRSPRPHGVDRAWMAGAPLGLTPGPDDWGLSARPEEIEAWHARAQKAGCDPDAPLLALHLTDPDDARAWHTEGFVAVAREAVGRGRTVLLNGAATRQPVAAQILRESGSAAVIDLTGRDDLRGLLAQFQAMARHPGNALLSTDSGPVHLATAVGLPAVCLSGPQDPARTGPRRGGFSVTAWEGLACAPCLERDCVLRPPERLCMRRISAEAALAALRRIWER